jgi:hypothetical protein
MSSIAFDGIKGVLRQERWRHIVLRHPELKNLVQLILDVVANPDEVYVDSAGAFHALKRVSGVSDFLVVIYGVNGEGYIRTAYFTSTVRKIRRYKAFKKLKPS